MPDSVLLIDDDADVLRAVGDYFDRIGYEVGRAETAQAGLEAFDRLRPDVVILDLHLPDVAGLEALGTSPAIRELGRQIELLAASERSTVLLTGESGTGKGWVARIIHHLSPRASGPFVEVNGGGLSATFLESELFGHEKGAFTDAKER